MFYRDQLGTLASRAKMVRGVRKTSPSSRRSAPKELGSGQSNFLCPLESCNLASKSMLCVLLDAWAPSTFSIIRANALPGARYSSRYASARTNRLHRELIAEGRTGVSASVSMGGSMFPNSSRPERGYRLARLSHVVGWVEVIAERSNEGDTIGLRFRALLKIPRGLGH